MKKLYLLLLSSVIFLMTVAYTFKPESIYTADYKQTLSAYGFFEGRLAALKPTKGVIPYTLNTPLFSDYASKARFVKLPEGQQATYNDQEVLNFPVGSVLIKNFYYPLDARKPKKGRRIMETRLLIHEKEGWVALPYIWNDAQTEANLDVAA